MSSWSSCLTPLTLLPHHSIFFGIVVKKRYGKRGFAIILKETISHESHNFRYSMPVWIGLLLRLRLIFTFRSFFFFFFFHVFWRNSSHKGWIFCSKQWSMHYSRTHKFHFSAIFSLKMGPTVLFTHLKIILLQYFQFSVFSFSKISSIQTDPQCVILSSTHVFLHCCPTIFFVCCVLFVCMWFIYFFVFVQCLCVCVFYLGFRPSPFSLIGYHLC